MSGRISRWFARHQHPLSLALHAVGIPLTIVALVLAGVQLAGGRWDVWYRPVVLLFAGYLLQWIGHRIEGNDMGEVIVVKKLMGHPYIAVSPRYGGAVEKPPARADAGPSRSSP